MHNNTENKTGRNEWAQGLEAIYHEAQARLDGLREAINTLNSLYSEQEQARNVARERWGAALRAEGVTR